MLSFYEWMHFLREWQVNAIEIFLFLISIKIEKVKSWMTSVEEIYSFVCKLKF